MSSKQTYQKKNPKIKKKNLLNPIHIFPSRPCSTFFFLTTLSRLTGFFYLNFILFILFFVFLIHNLNFLFCFLFYFEFPVFLIPKKKVNSWVLISSIAKVSDG